MNHKLDITKESASDARVADVPPYECWHLLGRASGIARVVWSGTHGAAIVPVNYTVADGAVWFQTTPESRFARECRNQPVLVEVDVLDAATHSGWSVIVAGVADFIDADEVPEILGDLQVWPHGPHSVFVRVAPDRLTGRRLVQRPGS
jgi:hypothetical protein